MTFVILLYCSVVVFAYILVMAWASSLSVKKLFIELWKSLFKKKSSEYKKCSEEYRRIMQEFVGMSIDESHPRYEFYKNRLEELHQKLADIASAVPRTTDNQTGSYIETYKLRKPITKPFKTDEF